MRVCWRRSIGLLVAVLLSNLVAWRSPASPQDMLALMQRITALAKDGRYGEATTLARKLESDAERTSGPQSPLTAMTLVVLAQVLQTQGETIEAEKHLRRALAIREKSLGPNHPDVAAVLSTLGQIELDQNRLNEAERDVVRAVAIDETALGADHLTTALARVVLGNIRHRQLREAEALGIFGRSLEAFKTARGPAEIMIPVALNNIAQVYQAQGRLQLAGQNLAEALALQEKQHGPDSLYLASTLNNLGELKRLQGRLAEAEQLARRTLAIREKALGGDHPDVAASLNNLALVFSREGRASEAEALLLRALTIQEKALGADHPNVATTLNNIADALAHLGRNKEAEQLLRRSLAIREKSLGANHPDVAVSLDNLVVLICEDERYAEAEPLARRSLAIREANLGKVHPLVASSLNNLAVIMDSTGRSQDAEPALKQALDIRQRTLGETHPDVANSLVNLGAHYLDLNNWTQALDAFARATAIIDSRRADEFADEQAKAGLKIHEDTNPFSGTIVADYNLAQASDGAKAAALRSQAFEAAQRIGDQQAARAIAGMSARVAAGNSDLGTRIRERQDLNEQALAVDRQLVATLSRQGASRNPQAEQALRAEASTIMRRMKEADRLITAQFPDYAALVTRTPISIEDVQRQLGANEAMLLITTTARFTFVWTVTRTDVHWHTAPLGEKQLADAIGALRCGLDDQAWADRTTPSCIERLGLQRPTQTITPLPFDLDRAYALYLALLGPAAKDIEGKELILVPSGPLATLPFEVLLTDKPDAASRADLAKAPWLVKRFATTVLPSVSSLKALRQIAQASKAPKPFIGFGNPLLDGDAERARQARLLQTCGNLSSQPGQLAQRAVRSVVSLSGTADIEQLRHQMPLPETALELCSVANSFTPVKGEVYLGNEATEAKIKSLSDSGRLQQYRVLHFATHGALAGQVHGAVEPGLILTPPAAAAPADDGYLSSSDISGLRLDADWVILSACNTAGGEDAHSEAFSGLARAFFYAGARALLVSHWPVSSDAAVTITTGTIQALIAHPDIDRAEALRRSIAALIAKGGENAEPSVWAPFVLVGK